eukprot:TRINITY_DN91319_c0_g1_i1.p1 TRINITY_DN91319_c0_g1~~TRINITY_DN91319_c0_g1_i1.p1  ORF type:complete len:334 (-),score=15.16 TRINITY_DN91319_c0_g1_i1:53-1054(-)
MPRLLRSASAPRISPHAGSGVVEFDAPDVRERKQSTVVGSQMCVVMDCESRLIVSRQLPECISHKDCDPPHRGLVAAPMRLGTFRPNEDMDYGQIRCPACDSQFVPAEMIFRKCTAEINYCFKNGSPQTLFFTTDVHNSCEVFGGRRIPLATYTTLVITTDEPGQKTAPDCPMQPMKEEEQPPRHSRPSGSASAARRSGPSGGSSSMLRTNTVHDPYELLERMAPADIRYGQDSCACKFQCGRLLDETMRGLRDGTFDVFRDIPPIRVFQWQGRIHTEDNRRLWCFKQAWVSSIPVMEVLFVSLDPDKLSTKNGGIEIRVRRAGPSMSRPPFT